MAGSGSLNLVPISSSQIDIQYSVNVTGSGRQAIMDIIDTPTHGGAFFLRVELGAGFHESTYNLTGLQPSTQYRVGLYDFKSQSDYTQLDFKICYYLSKRRT